MKRKAAKASTVRKAPARKRAAPTRPKRQAAAPAKRAERKAWGGVQVNAEIPLPRPPGPWVDEVKNYVTGENFRSGITFADGVELVRSAARAQRIPGDGYRSRGPVLWAMHCLKLQAWYLEAMNDGALWDHARRRPLELVAPKRRRVKRKTVKAYRADPRWGF